MVEVATAELDDDDDDRATFPIPERAPEPLSPEPPSPVPEPAATDERSAPTQPPSRVARKAAATKALAGEADTKGKEGVTGFVLKSILAAVAAFLGTTFLVPLLVPDREASPTHADGNVAAPPPAAAPAPVISAPGAAQATSSALTLRAEAIPPPAGVTLDPAQGLVDIELAEPSSIKVDDSFHGRFDKRRLLLAPGKHRIEIENDRGSATLELDVAAGRALRVASGVPGSAGPASSSAE
jgi:hypothetical protein